MVSRATHQSITHLLFLSFLATVFVAHGMHDWQKDLQYKRTKQNALSRLDGFFDSLVTGGHSQYSLQHPLSEHERNAVEEVGKLIPAVGMRLEVNAIFLTKKSQTSRWHMEKAEVNKLDQERLALLDATLSRHPVIRELFQFDAGHFPLNAESNAQQLVMLDGAATRVIRLLTEDDELKRSQVPAYKEPAAISQAAEKAVIVSTIAQGGVLLAQPRRGSIV